MKFFAARTPNTTNQNAATAQQRNKFLTVALLSASIVATSATSAFAANVYKKFKQAKNGDEIVLTYKGANNKTRTRRGIIENMYEKKGKDGKPYFGCYLTVAEGKIEVTGSKMQNLKIIPNVIPSKPIFVKLPGAKSKDCPCPKSKAKPKQAHKKVQPKAKPKEQPKQLAKAKPKEPEKKDKPKDKEPKLGKTFGPELPKEPAPEAKQKQKPAKEKSKVKPVEKPPEEEKGLPLKLSPAPEEEKQSKDKPKGKEKKVAQKPTKEKPAHKKGPVAAIDIRADSSESNGVGGRVNFSTKNFIGGLSARVARSFDVMFSHRVRKTTGTGIDGVNPRPVETEAADTTIGGVRWFNERFAWLKVGLRDTVTTVSGKGRSETAQSTYFEAGAETPKHKVRVNNKGESEIEISGQRKSYTAVAGASTEEDKFEPVDLGKKVNPDNASKRKAKSRYFGVSKRVTKKTEIGMRGEQGVDKVSNWPKTKEIRTKTRSLVATVRRTFGRTTVTAEVGRVHGEDSIGNGPGEKFGYQKAGVGISREIGNKGASLEFQYNKSGQDEYIYGGVKFVK
ncbi:Uncharacterised protein [Candidatus Gugararchaeum adminiculabundum]|nr:Uncharacterised protein [Candidatus Gugararchaeum adminiculabundum]